LAQKKPLDLIVIACEKSADSLGSDLLSKLPPLNIAAVAGPKMRTFPIEVLIPMESFEVMGFVDVALNFPKLCHLFFKLKKLILERNPRAVIFIDYPGLNLALAKALRKKGYSGRLIQYVCPSIWAYRKNRAQTMINTLDHLYTLLPFEAELFDGTSLKAEFVGHPLEKKIDPPKERGKLLALFPGSREKEVMRNLPLQLEVAKETNLPLGISVASPKLRPLIEKMSGSIPLFNDPYSLMKNADVAIATSGTINLELALHEVPTVVTFAITPLDLFIARKIFKIDLDHYCLVNILLKKRLFPELYGPNFTKEGLTSALNTLLNDKEAVRKSCRLIRSLLKCPSTHPFQVQ